MLQSLNHDSWSKKIGIKPQIRTITDYWLRTSAESHVYAAWARRKGTGCLFQFTYCEVLDFQRVDIKTGYPIGHKHFMLEEKLYVFVLLNFVIVWECLFVDFHKGCQIEYCLVSFLKLLFTFLTRKIKAGHYRTIHRFVVFIVILLKNDMSNTQKRINVPILVSI